MKGMISKELCLGQGEEIRELRISIGVHFPMIEDKGNREMTLKKRQILNYLQLSLIEKKALTSIISGK